ncbi:MAG: hypothetical protein V1738_01925 [Patescibacteria group bacterium]
MYRLSIMLAAIVLVGAGCISIIEPGTTTDVVTPSQSADDALADGAVTTNELDQLLISTCSETGGVWNTVAEPICVCPTETTLDTDSGECLTADGTPGGARGEALRARYELMVACKETAGIYDEATAMCTCPDGDTRDEMSGECRTADGEPDGIRGQEAKELRFENNCKTSGGTYDSTNGGCACLNGPADTDGNCPSPAA